MADTKLNKEEARTISEEAYIFGYPLVLMDITRNVMTAVAKPEESKAPVNQFVHMRKFPDATFTEVVSPNADTLYSCAWLNLTQEPMILSVPAMPNRYYLMPMLDAWTNVFSSPGTRTTGDDKGAFAIVGPGWKGKLPNDVHEIKAPTHMVWIIGRTQTNGKDDYAAVNAIQDQYSLTPLSAWGKSYTPPSDVPVEKNVDTNTPPPEQVARMDALTFFSRLNALMKENPPASADAQATKRFASIGIVPGAPMNLQKLDLEVVEGLNDGVRSAREKIVAEAKQPQGNKINGWDVMPNLGRYGVNYPMRALIALVGLGANLTDDAIYPHATVDADQKPLTGKNQYVVEFQKDQLPPVNAFWSITMYNSRQFFVDNPLNRYAIGDRDKLKLNDDGSLTLYVQNQSPGPDKQSNWLPAPKDEFNLFMRLYWPKKEIIDGTWKMPPVKRQSTMPKTEAA
jgi:hypothetical protein